MNEYTTFSQLKELNNELVTNNVRTETCNKITWNNVRLNKSVFSLAGFDSETVFRSYFTLRHSGTKGRL